MNRATRLYLTWAARIALIISILCFLADPK